MTCEAKLLAENAYGPLRRHASCVNDAFPGGTFESGEHVAASRGPGGSAVPRLHLNVFPELPPGALGHVQRIDGAGGMDCTGLPGSFGRRQFLYPGHRPPATRRSTNARGPMAAAVVQAASRTRHPEDGTASSVRPCQSANTLTPSGRIGQHESTT